METLKVSFKKRPIPVPVDYRPVYKVAQIILILKYCCRSNTSSLIKLHFFSWALKSNENMEYLLNVSKGVNNTQRMNWGLEPTLNRALQLAVAEKICLVNVKTKKYTINIKGQKFFDLIEKDVNLFSDEKNILKSIGKNSITDERIEKLFKQLK